MAHIFAHPVKTIYRTMELNGGNNFLKIMSKILTKYETKLNLKQQKANKYLNTDPFSIVIFILKKTLQSIHKI